MILDDSNPNVALVDKYEAWMDGTMVHIDEENNIVNFVPKEAFKYEHIDSYYKTVNIYKFSRDFSINTYVPFWKLTLSHWVIMNIMNKCCVLLRY